MKTKRAWFAPEVVQTSTMDCGPAALACLCNGFGIDASYGRLREACQTDVAGTSIDTIEEVAAALGLDAEQVLLPVDHALGDDANLPALVVVRHADFATHFVVAWRRVGSWLQVMDPAIGRRWVRTHDFAADVLRHEVAVPAADWRAWAASTACANALVRRLTLLGADTTCARLLVDGALSDAGWFPIGALDAAIRLAQVLVDARGLARGVEAVRFVETLQRETCARGDDIYAAIPSEYWSARPLADHAETQEMLTIRGAVLMRVQGSRGRVDAPRSRELAAALAERRTHPLASAWAMLRDEGVVSIGALVAATVVAAVAVVVEALLFRGLFDVTAFLALPSQRLIAACAVLAFLALVFAFDMPVVAESIRLGRHLELRLRMALLAKLGRLDDRYFQSRPISDMAERAHAIQAARQLPGLALRALQAACELVLTWIGIVVVAPGAIGWASALAFVAIAIPLAAQPLLNERDLRQRNHAGALGGFYLDALLGLAPIRAHRAERAVRRQHEALLVEWSRAASGWIRTTLAIDAVQFTLCATLAGGLLLAHFRAGGVVGTDLLLVFWTLKLPSIGARVASLAQQYPGQRNALARLLEPLAAPDDGDVVSSAVAKRGGVAIDIAHGRVVAGGHDILRDVDLAIASGEHVAIVGVSGAGKSSLLGVLLGWHRLAEGEVRIDRAPLDASLRQATAWVDPAVQLWNRSLLDNVAFASDDDGLARTGEILGVADLHDLVEKLPDGLQTCLGEGGALLSGGEGQRVRLARALAMRAPRLVLLDEPFRGLDRPRRRALLGEARAWWSATTMLCVTHDVGETRAFDRVLVVEDGRIVEDGPPDLLAARPSRYRALLEAETVLHDALWSGPQWRRIEVADGTTREQVAA